MAERASTAHEHGDRRAFLAEARRRLEGGVEVNGVHRPPPPTEGAPAPRHRAVDATDLAGTFARIATNQGAEVHRVPGSPSDDDGSFATVLAGVVERHGIRTAVHSDDPEAVATADLLGRLGVEVEPATADAVAHADLGVTSATVAVAATGSVVLDRTASGSRTVSLLPSVHLCVVPVGRLVPDPGEVWRSFTGHPERLPSNLVWVSGPSRTGDIEQLLTIGVHGPLALAVVLTDDGPRKPGKPGKPFYGQ